MKDESTIGICRAPASWRERLVPVDDADAAREGDRGYELLHRVGETFFGEMGPELVRRGWSVFPQRRDGKRGPATVDGRALKWGAYVETAPTPAEVSWWAIQNPSANVALALGPASGDVIALDVDVDDPERSVAIQIIADEVLGPTPFRRVGRAPRAVLLYRLDRAGGELRSAQHRFADGIGAVELLSRGKPVTVYGRHHATGGYFKWLGAQPLLVGPEAAPRVTAEQIERFLDRVSAEVAEFAVREHQRALSFNPSQILRVHDDGTLDAPGGVECLGVWRDADGIRKIFDGRKDWLFRRSAAWVCCYPDLAQTPEGRGRILAAMIAEATARIALGGDLGTVAAVEALVERKLASACEALAAGRLGSFVTISEDGSRQFVTASAVAMEGADKYDLEWLPAPEKRRRLNRHVYRGDIEAPCPERAAKRALLRGAAREAVMADVGDRVRQACRVFIRALRNGAMEDREALSALHLLYAPTGAGKTTTLMREIAADVAAHGPLPRAVAFIAPSHANLGEVAERAVGEGAIDVLEAVEAAENAGLRVLHWKGKLLAGCMREEEMKTLADAEIQSGGLCRALVKGPGGETEEKVCPFWGSCGYTRQLALLPRADVVLLPHAYLTCPLPKALDERIGAVVIDERYWTSLLGHARIPDAILKGDRREPYVTKEEKGSGLTGADLLHERGLAVEVLLRALDAGRCPAESLRDHADGPLSGLDLVQSAKKVCARSQTAHKEVTPDITLEGVKHLVEKKIGGDARAEAALWSVVEQRIRALDDGTAKQSREQRLARFHGEEGKEVLVCWRSKPNFADRPHLILDASASPEILRKLYPGREIVETRIDAPIHMRVLLVPERFSDSSIIGRGEEEGRLETVRIGLTRLASLYSDVLVCSTQTVREAMTHAWGHPANCDFLHYGNLRGFDFARRHDLCVTVGRLEAPAWVIDAYARALAYDDEDEFVPVDPRGDGTIDGKKPIPQPKGERTVLRRDGGSLKIDDVLYEEGSWQRVVQDQLREQELLQAAGRLRPIYRPGAAPLWICASTALPEGIVVDDVATWADIASGAGARIAEAARIADGVLGATVAAAAGARSLPSEREIEGLSIRENGRRVEVLATVDGEAEPRRFLVEAWADAATAVEAGLRRAWIEVSSVEVVASVVKREGIRKAPDAFDLMQTGLPPTATAEDVRRARADAEILAREEAEARLRSPPAPLDEAA